MSVFVEVWQGDRMLASLLETYCVERMWVGAPLREGVHLSNELATRLWSQARLREGAQRASLEQAVGELSRLLPFSEVETRRRYEGAAAAQRFIDSGACMASRI